MRRGQLLIFLDSNVVHSASRSADSPLNRLWLVPQWELLSCPYSKEELYRNCESEDHARRLNQLLSQMRTVSDRPDLRLPESLSLPAKDVPIFLAALAGGAEYLITGDKGHFGQYFNQTHDGVTIMEPMPFLHSQTK